MGGVSAEHSISIRSAAAICAALSKTPHDVTVVGLATDGTWLCADFSALLQSARDKLVTVERDAGQPVGLAFDGDRTRLIDLASGSTIVEGVDVVFPALHGPGGEDGSVQGLLESMRVAFVGAGSGASAIAIDKLAMKHLCKGCGIEQADFVDVSDLNDREAIDLIEASFGFPCFVKPSRLGSSLGISRVGESAGLAEALEQARRFDVRVVVEQAVDGREIEVAMMGDRNPDISPAGEIVAKGGFYDFESKYVTDDVELIAPTRVDPDTYDRMVSVSRRAWNAIGCRGMARADFFVRNGDGKVLLNELNTIPGFTAISMFPRLWKATGLSMEEIVERLIALALESGPPRPSGS